MNGTRLLLAVLVVLNIGYFAWTRGGLAMFGTVPAALAEREPQRMAQQVRPAALQIRKESDIVAPAPAVDPAPSPEPTPVAPASSAEPRTDHEGL